MFRGDGVYVIVGGAGLLGYAAMLSPAFPVPLLDSVSCGIEMAAERIEIPVVIGGERLRTGATDKAVMPHDHHHA